MEHPTGDYQMSPYQLKQQTSGMYSQDDLIGQRSNNPYIRADYEHYGRPGINPCMMMDSREGDLTRINGGNMVNPSMPPDAHTAPHAHAVPHNGALNSQPSSYSDSQANPHMQQPQAHMGITPNQSHHSITNQSIHGQGIQHAHSTGHSMPQAGPHQSSGGYGSQNSPHMMPQHPMRHTGTQQPMVSFCPMNQMKIRRPFCCMKGPTFHACSKFMCKNCKERELTKQTLATDEKELEQRGADFDLQALLGERKEPMAELMKEGENLSKQQLQSSTIIEKLLAKEKENETIIAAQKKKLDEQTKELEKLITVLDSKQKMENVQSDAMYQLQAEVQKQEKVQIKHKSYLEDAQEKIRGVQTALDILYEEERHRSNASQDSKAQEVLSAETHVREALEASMEREQQQFKQEQEAFIKQIDSLKRGMDLIDKYRTRREDRLRLEIAYLKERLQKDETKSPDLTQSVTSAMMPLLRQIENLQATLGAQSVAWERVEKNLTDRLAQIALAMAQGKERTTNDHLIDLSVRVTSLEAANKQEIAQLVAELESDRPKLEELLDITNSDVAQLESSKQMLNEELTQ